MKTEWVLGCGDRVVSDKDETWETDPLHWLQVGDEVGPIPGFAPSCFPVDIGLKELASCAATTLERSTKRRKSQSTGETESTQWSVQGDTATSVSSRPQGAQTHLPQWRVWAPSLAMAQPGKALKFSEPVSSKYVSYDLDGFCGNGVSL